MSKQTIILKLKYNLNIVNFYSMIKPISTKNMLKNIYKKILTLIVFITIPMLLAGCREEVKKPKDVSCQVQKDSFTNQKFTECTLVSASIAKAPSGARIENPKSIIVYDTRELPNDINSNRLKDSILIIHINSYSSNFLSGKKAYGRTKNGAFKLDDRASHIMKNRYSIKSRIRVDLGKWDINRIAKSESFDVKVGDVVFDLAGSAMSKQAAFAWHEGYRE